MTRTGLIEGAPDFAYEEFTASDTAVERKLNNIPTTDEVWDNIAYLARTCLQPIRDQFGVVLVTSGYRSHAVNSAVCGSPTSHHLRGCAADIRTPNAALKDVFAWAVENIPFTELIAENIGGTPWVHVAIVKGREDEKATKYQPTGRTVRKADVATILALDW